jgi:hypothetical protein
MSSVNGQSVDPGGGQLDAPLASAPHRGDWARFLPARLAAYMAASAAWTTSVALLPCIGYTATPAETVTGGK